MLNKEKNIIKNNDYSKEIKLLVKITKDCYVEDYGLVNTFAVFKSININLKITLLVIIPQKKFQKLEY